MNRTYEVALADNFKFEKKVFVFSIFYLFAHFGVIGAETVIKAFSPYYSAWPEII
jgi:hypothetical protein